MDKVLLKLSTFFNENDDLQIFAMNGSRVNNQVRKDKFQDYDVVFFTNDVKKYKQNPNFLAYFGELLILCEPDGRGVSKRELSFPTNKGYIFLAQYSDGLRLDIQFLSMELLNDYLKSDSLTQIIETKIQLEQTILSPSDELYNTQMSTDDEIVYTVKEFWWQFLNVLKAGLRDQFLLAQFHLNLVREELITLVTYVIVLKNNQEENFGKKKDGVFKHISNEQINCIKQSYHSSSIEQIFERLKVLGDFERTFLLKLQDYVEPTLLNQLLNLNNVPLTYLLAKEEEVLADFFKST